MKTFLDDFRNPPAEFSPFPFWFLNGDLNENEMERQLTDFKNKGINGVVLHPRIGVPKSLPYLSKSFMDKMVFAVKCAKSKNMKVLLYDEAMYPSGSAHGKVVAENPDFAAKGISPMRAEETGKPFLRIAIRMIGENEYDPASARVLRDDEPVSEGETVFRLKTHFTGGTIRGIHEDEDDGQANAPKAGDLLNADAMRAFIRYTHEAYYAAMPEEFGETVIGFFTDEPNPVGRCVPRYVKPWTTGFEEELIQKGFELKNLPALWLNAKGSEEKIRADYRRCVSHRLKKTYYQPIADWCLSHGIALCGHPDSAQDSSMLTCFQIPGQDVVWRWVAPENGLALSGKESAQAKCASDCARHIGAKRNLNECFGCCGPNDEMWAFTVKDMKWYLDWLFARGCNFIIPHAFFYELKQPVQFDRPPDVGPNNIWWPHYRRLADYISWMCMLNTGGVNSARVAVLGTGDSLPVESVKTLYERQIEFNYLTDECLLENAVFENGRLCVAEQAYEAVLLDETLSYAPEAIKRIKQYRKQGLRVLKRIPNRFKTVRLTGDARGIRVTRVFRDDLDIVMLFNEGERSYQGTLEMPFSGEIMVLDAWNGKAARERTGEDGKTWLKLESRQSMVFVSGTDTNGLKMRERMPARLSRKPLDDRWLWRLPDGKTKKGVFDWSEIPEMETFSGTLACSASLRLAEIPEKAELDLGDVREIAVLTVNGNRLDALLLPPYRADITKYLRKGNNVISAEITNSLVGKYAQKKWPGGLLGGSAIYVYGKK